MSAPFCVGCVYHRPSNHNRYSGEFDLCKHPSHTEHSIVTGVHVGRDRYCELERQRISRGGCGSEGVLFAPKSGDAVRTVFVLIERKRWWQWWKS